MVTLIHNTIELQRTEGDYWNSRQDILILVGGKLVSLQDQDPFPRVRPPWEAGALRLAAGEALA